MGFYKRFFRFKPMMWSKMYTLSLIHISEPTRPY